MSFGDPFDLGWVTKQAAVADQLDQDHVNQTWTVEGLHVKRGGVR